MNYECVIRTNYFSVKDEKAFKKFMDSVYASEDAIQVFEKTIDGVKKFGFGCYGGISGVDRSVAEGDQHEDDYFAEPNYDDFLMDLREHVADDDAIIIFEAGNEGLRYVTGYADVITSREISFVNLEEAAVKLAGNLLLNNKWKTSTAY